MNTRNLTVRYSTEGFAGAINSLQQVGQAFDSALAQSQQAAATAANAAKNAVNPEEIEQANKEIERSVVRANQIIGNSYKALGVRQEADVRRQKESAIAAFNAIKNSGVASANDIARAEVALNRRLQELDRSLETVEQQAKQTGGGFTVLKGAIAGVISGAVLSGLGSATNFIGNLARSVFTAGTTTENLKAQLKTLTGSAEGAATAYGKIAEFAKTTPYELEEVTQAYISLANRGVKPTNALLTQLGDIAASQGKPLQQAVEAILDATTGENERLKEFGINASKSGDQVTFTFKGVSKTVNATAEEISKAILSFGELDGVLGGMNERAKTTEGQLSNLTDSLKAVYTQIFDAIKPALDGVISSATSIIAPLAEQEGLFADINVQAQEFKDYLKDNPEIVEAIGSQLKSGILAVMQGITATAKQFLGYLQENPTAVQETVNKLGLLLTAMAKFVAYIGKSIEGWEKIVTLITLAQGKIQEQATLKLAADNGISKEEVRARFKEVYGFDPYGAGSQGVTGTALYEEKIEKIVQELVSERATQQREINSYGPPVPPEPYGPPVPKDVLKVPAKAVAQTSGSLPANVLPPPTSSQGGSPSEPKAKKELTSEQQFAAKTIAIAKELKIDPQALMTIMLFESQGTLSPKIQGPMTSQGKGRGLIQFMPPTAKGLGTSDAALAGMTQLQQLDWVKKYFAQFKGNFGAGKLENLYAAVLAGNPQKVDASDGHTTAKQAAVRMTGEWGKKAASLLGSVPQGEDLADQYEFDTSLEDAQKEREQELQRQKEEQRRKEERQRQDTRERREQQQKLELKAFEDKNTQELLEFDQFTNTLPETEKPAREFLRGEKEREIELAEKLLAIEQQIRNLEIERAEKVADIKAGYEVSPKDITAEIQALEKEKESANKTFESSKSQGRSEFAKGFDSEAADSALKLKKEVGGYFLDEEAIALSAVEEKYQGYQQSIDEAVKSLEALISNKKLLGQSTVEESKAIAALQEQKSLIPQYQKAETNDLKRDFRLERKSEKLDIEGQLIDKDAQISGQKANFLDRIGFTFAANDLKRKSAIDQEKNRYQKELLELEKQFKDDPGSKELGELKEKAEELNRVNLEGIKSEFKTVGQTIKDLGIDAIQGFVQNVATNFFDSRGDRDKALMEERLRYAEELVQLEGQFKEEPGHLAHLKNRARELNEEKLDKIKGEFNGFKRVIGVAGQALLEFTKQLAAMAAQYAAAKVISSIFKTAAFDGGGTVQNASEGITVGAGGNAPFYGASSTPAYFDEGGGIKGRKVSDRLTDWMRGSFSGVANAWNAEGEGAQLGVFHIGEELLSRKTGEAGRYQALKARYGFNPLEKIGRGGGWGFPSVSNHGVGVFADGGTVGANVLSSIGSTRPRIDLSGLKDGNRGQKAQASKNVTINTTVVTPNADSFRLNQDQMNQDLMERLRRGI